MCNPITVRYPDHLLVRGEYQGYQYEVTRNHSYYRCGYVHVPVDHPWYGAVPSVNVHTGITYTEPDSDSGWWLGFECSGALDKPDRDLMDDNAKERQSEMDVLFSILRDRGTVRSTEYVVSECERLIDQAIAAAAHRRHWSKLWMLPRRS
jgi:hypothetical protein